MCQNCILLYIFMVLPFALFGTAEDEVDLKIKISTVVKRIWRVLRIDKTNWIDPSDPLSKSPIYNQYSLGGIDSAANKCDGNEEMVKCLQEYETLRNELLEVRKQRANSVDTLMKHVLRQFFSKLNINLNKSETVFKKAQVILSRDDLSLLRRYLNSEKVVEEFGLREDLRTVLEIFSLNSHFQIDLRSDNSFFSFLHQLLPYLIVLNVILLIPFFLILLQSAVSTRKLMAFLFLSTFCWSCYATYMRKYQELLAARFLRTDAKFRTGSNPCSPQGLISEAFDVLLSYVKIKDKSECLKAYEDELIAPFWQVDPLQVIAEVLSNFFLGGLPVSGNHLNQFFNNFFINTPLHLALVKVLFVFVMPLAIVYIGYLYAINRPNERQQRRRQIQRRENEEERRIEGTETTKAMSRRNSQAELTGAESEASQE